MNQMGKDLKLSCIACLFAGLATLVVGIVAGVQGLFDVDAIATIVAGLGATPAGAQASRLANVPSNAKRVRAISIVVLLADIALACASYFMGSATPMQYVAFALVGIVALAMTVFAHRVAKDVERVV